MTAAHQIQCPSCGGAIAIKAAGYTVTVACQYCGSILDVTNPDVRLITEYHQAMQSLQLPLGSRGTLFDVEWEAVGHLDRFDGEVSWSEYLLFNPYAGYRWLVCSDGEWQFGTMLLDRPEGKSHVVGWRGSYYRRDYDPATTTTKRVLGEFYWRVNAGDQVDATTYSGANDSLSFERSGDELNWTQLIALDSDTVHAAFGLAAPSDGVSDAAYFTNRLSANYSPASASRPPIMLEADLPPILGLSFLTAMAILLVMIMFGWSTSHTQNTALVAVDGPEQSITIGTLTVSRPYQFVTVTAQSDQFVNKWVDLDYSLVDRKTQQSIDAYGLIEYYTGRDSDGPWTEGSRTETTKVAGVPRGTYDVVVDASAHRWSSWSGNSTQADNGWGSPPVETITVWFDAKAGGIMWGNYVSLLIMLFGLPILIVWYRLRNRDDE